LLEAHFGLNFLRNSIEGFQMVQMMSWDLSWNFGRNRKVGDEGRNFGFFFRKEGNRVGNG
jgi:hypothetical protein